MYVKKLVRLSITKTHLFKYIGNFTSKNWKFSDKKSDTLHISAQNIDCGYSLELPRRGSSNENRLGEAVLTSTHYVFEQK